MSAIKQRHAEIEAEALDQRNRQLQSMLGIENVAFNTPHDTQQATMPASSVPVDMDSVDESGTTGGFVDTVPCRWVDQAILPPRLNDTARQAISIQVKPPIARHPPVAEVKFFGKRESWRTRFVSGIKKWWKDFTDFSHPMYHPFRQVMIRRRKKS